MPRLVETLTRQFYEWECLGRGWMLGESAVQLEPQFTPFFKHRPRLLPVIDDGVHHTMLSRVAALFKKSTVQESQQTLPEVSYDLYVFDDDSPTVTMRLHIPKGHRGSMHEMIEFLVMLSYSTSPISVEYIATHTAIIIQIGCRQQYATYIQGQVRAFLPGIGISDAGIDLPGIISDDKAIAVTDFGLRDEFMRPIAQAANTGIDALTGIFSIFDTLRENEHAIVQILFNGVINPWEQSMLRAVSDGKQGPFFEDAPEMLPMTREKISSPLFAVAIRLLTQSSNATSAMQLLETFCFAVTQASKSQGNSLVPLPHNTYTVDQRVTDIAFRESHRAGMLLNVKELATFVHIPIVQSKKLFWKQRKTKAAPDIAKGHSLVLGTNEHEGKSSEVSLGNEQRLKHTHIIGATGTGKSTLLLSMIVQDILEGRGVAVLDPHGDLIDAILSYIPENRMHDMIIVDPSDSDYPIGFNILHAHSDIEKEILSSDLVASFKRNSTSWGDQMNSVFGNAVIAMLESTRECTLADLRRFLIEKQFREDFLTTVPDPNIRYYWQKEYPLLRTNSVGPILTRLDTFLRPKLIRNMVCQQRGLNFEAILGKQKILLVKLSQGLIGVENSYLLGSFVVSKIHQAALARQATQVRNDFFFYIDEFQHFITPSMAGILSGARKYRLGLVLAHHDMQQLQKYDSEVASSVIANAGTRICFRTGETDARKLAEGFSYFEPQDIQNLDTGQAIVRIERSEFDFSLDTMPVDASTQPADIKEKVIAFSRSQYAIPKQVVEDTLSRTMRISHDGIKNEDYSKKSQPITQPPEEIKPLDIQESRPAPVYQSEGPPPKQLHTSIDKQEDVVKQKEASQHRYLQTLIKKMAEARGYKATIEMQTPDGTGKVDVLLEKDDKKIACEVSVTTDAAWEIHNIQKCLAAGYTIVVSCMTDKKAAVLLQKKIQEQFPPEQVGRIKVFEPDMLFSYLDSFNVTEILLATETTVKGYRVKVNYDKLTDEEMKRKRESVARIVGDSLKKMKK